jgi:hypothetical protein
VWGVSRNLNIYNPNEVEQFASELADAPMYIEHVAVPNAVGKATKATWDGQRLMYEAQVFDEETAEKIRKDRIKHVSVGADYETLDLVTGKVPHGLHNSEISRVAVACVPEAQHPILTKLRLQEAIIVGNIVEITLLGEFRVGSVEYVVDGVEQTLETGLALGVSRRCWRIMYICVACESVWVEQV